MLILRQVLYEFKLLSDSIYLFECCSVPDLILDAVI